MTFNIRSYTRDHLIEQIMILRRPRRPAVYRARLCRARFTLLQKINRLLMP
jgi:hypothetical protein